MTTELSPSMNLCNMSSVYPKQIYIKPTCDLYGRKMITLLSGTWLRLVFIHFVVFFYLPLGVCFFILFVNWLFKLFYTHLFQQYLIIGDVVFFLLIFCTASITFPTFNLASGLPTSILRYMQRHNREYAQSITHRKHTK